MANVLFKKWVDWVHAGGSMDLTDGSVKVVGIDTGTHDPDPGSSGDEFYSDISTGAKNTPTALVNPTMSAGIFNADDLSFPDPGGGATYDVLVIFYDTGTPATSRLIARIEDAGGLPVTLDGAADLITWPAGGIIIFA